MKKSLALVFGIIMCFTIKGQSTAEDLDKADVHRYNIKSGSITYEISGDATGSATYVFDNWGWKNQMVRKMTYELYGLKSEENRLEIEDGDYKYKIDLANSKGTKSTDRQLSGLMKYKSSEESREAIYTSQGGKMMGKDQLFEKEVTIWKFDNGNTLEIWEWDGIPLKIVKKLSKVAYTMTATMIEVDTSPDIQIPEGIEWQ